MEIFALVIGCFAIGLIARSIEPRTILLSSWINKIIINLIFPIMVLSAAPDIKFSINSLFVVLAPWLCGACLFIPFCVWASRKLHLSHQEEAVVILLSILGNTAFLGLGMVRAFLGESSIPSAVLYDQMGSFMILSIVGTIVIAVYSHQGADKESRIPSITTILRKVISFPPFIALFISFFIPSTESLGPFLVPFKWIGGAIVPLALIVIGLQIELRVDTRHHRPIFLVLCLKMLVLPLLTLISAIVFGVSNPQFSTSVFQAAMPPMVTPAIMLINARIAPKLAASILGIGTLTGFITLPLWAHLLTNVV